MWFLCGSLRSVEVLFSPRKSIAQISLGWYPAFIRKSFMVIMPHLGWAECAAFPWTRITGVFLIELLCSALFLRRSPPKPVKLASKSCGNRFIGSSMHCVAVDKYPGD